MGRIRAQWYTPEIVGACDSHETDPGWLVRKGKRQMAQMAMICPTCRSENEAGKRFCSHCGRLLVEPGHDASQAQHAPLYLSQGVAAMAPISPAQSATPGDIRHARIVIRVFPADFDSSDESHARTVGEYALDGRTITIGRGAQCDIIFDGDTMTSRRHAILRCEADHYYVADLGSSNGTFVNDHEVRGPTALVHGDRVQIGQHELLFLLGQPQTITPAEYEVSDAQQPLDAPEVISAPTADAVNESRQRLTAAPAPSPSTEKYASIVKLSSDLAESASKMVAPTQQDEEAFAELRAVFLKANEALNKQVNIQSMLAERRSAALFDIRDRAASLIAALSAAHSATAPATMPIDELAALAEDVANDPNDLNRLRKMSARAGEIAQALRSAAATEAPTDQTGNSERQHVLEALADIHSIAKNRG